MSIIILILICILLVIRGYLLPFDATGKLPYHHAFSLFSIFIMLLGLINGIYIFGIGSGIIFFLLIFFNILQLCFLWPFILLLSVLFYKNIQMTIYSIFPLGTWILLFLTIINFFISNYKSLDYWIDIDFVKYFIIVGFISAIIGQIAFKKITNVLIKNLIKKSETF